MLWHGKNFRGFLHHALQILFEKTGTTLQSTNGEDAIKELDSNLSHESVSVNINNGDTWGTLLTRLYSAIDTSKVTNWAKVVIANRAIYDVLDSAGLSFSRNGGSPTGIYNNTMTLGSTCYMRESTGSTRTDITNQNVDSAYIGSTAVLYYR